MSEIHVGVDTNILCNFGQIERFKWRDLFPGVTTVNLLVSATVQEEMDLHKDTARGNLQKRAREFQRILTAAEDTGYIHTSEASGVTVNIAFLDTPPSQELNLSGIDLSSSDARIVAEYFHEQTRLGQKVVLLANDARPIRIARNVGMAAMRPSRWANERSEVEDEIVVQQRERIRELERIVGARPDVNFVNLNSAIDYPLPHEFEEFDWAKYLGSLNLALGATTRPADVDALIKQYGLEPYGAFTMPGLSSRLTSDQIAEYQSDLAAFIRHFDIPALEFRERLIRLGRAYTCQFEIENSGQAPDELLSLELKLSSNAVFVDDHELEDLNDWNLRAPEPPRPQAYLIDHDWNQHRFRDTDADRYDFKLHDNAAYRRTYRCGSILHGHSAHVSIGILPTSAGEAIDVLATLRTKNLLEPIVRKVAITPSLPPFNEHLINQFLLKHARFMPDHQHDLVVRMIHHIEASAAK